MADAILAQGGIYQIRNIVDGKVYIGSAVNIKARFSTHKNHLATGRHCNIKLSRAWAKYGPEAFVFETVEGVPDKADLIAREQHWMDHLMVVACGYNICPVAGNLLGLKQSPEATEKIAAKLRGRKRPKEVCDKISAAKMGIKTGPALGAKVALALRGYKHTAETRAKMAAAQRGRKQTSESIEKTRAANIGRKHSPEAIERMSASHRGVKQGPEWIANRMAGMQSVFNSDEYKAKLSAAMTGRVVSESTKQKLRDSKTPEFRKKVSETMKAVRAKMRLEKSNANS